MPVSVSSAAVELAREKLGSLKTKKSAVVGLGKMGQICVKHLLSESGEGPVALLNRSQSRVQSFLQNKLNNRERLKDGGDFENRAAVVAQSDLAVIAASCSDFVLTKQSLQAHRKDKTDKLIIIDIAVPRSVDPEVATLAGIELYVADDLSKIVGKNLAERESLVSEAEKIVFEQLEGFHNWERSLLVVPTIAELREKIENIRIEQIAKNCAAGGVESEFSSKSDMESISRAIVNQILHHPTVHLKATKDYEILRQQAEALRKLFNLDPIAANPENYGHRSEAARVDAGSRYERTKAGRHSQLSKH